MAKLRINGETISVEGCGRCSTCGTIKASSEFYRDRTRATGCSSRCKSCEAERGRTRSVRYSLINDLKELAAKHPRYREVLQGATASLAA